MQDALEARLCITLLRATAVLLLGAPLAAAQAVVEQQARERQGGGDDGPTAEGMPEQIGVHGMWCERLLASPQAVHPPLPTILSRTGVLSIVGDVLSRVQYLKQRTRIRSAMHPNPYANQHFSLDPLALGQRIAALRHGAGLSQRRLAEAAGVSHGYIALLELGRLPSPGKFRLDAVARALDLRTSDALLAPLAPAGPDLAGPPPLAAGAALRANPSPGAPGEMMEMATRTQANVVGPVEQLRASGARPLPVFRWGACGDPRDQESPPDPDHLEYPPPGRETLIGPNGFGVMVKGDSMAARGIFDGDVVWVNPERPYAFGKVVLALVSDVGGNAGMVVKTYARTEVGECLLSETATGRSPVLCREFKIIGPVVGITSWRLPT